MVFSVVFFVNLLSIVQQASSWGDLGHRTVAYLAERHFTAEGSQYVQTLLNGEDISDAAIWPDEVRHTLNWTFTAGWHFIDARDDPPRTCEIKFDRDCLPRAGCVVSAINNMTSRITNTTLPSEQRYQALKFLLHLLGDIHQPLHTEAEGHGGNDIAVLFDGNETNLHAVWDSSIPTKIAGGRTSKPDAAKWAQRLDESGSILEKIDLSTALGPTCPGIQDPITCALAWAADANAYICSYVLAQDVAGVQGRELAGEYYDGAKPVVEALVRLAGLRLAAWINALAVEPRAQGLEGDKAEGLQGGSAAGSDGVKAAGLETDRKEGFMVQMDGGRRPRFWRGYFGAWVENRRTAGSEVGTRGIVGSA